MKQLYGRFEGWKQHIGNWLVILFLVLLGTQILPNPAYATGVYEIPPLSGTWLVDKADVFSLLNAGQISGSLEKLAKDTGNEVHMVTIRRLDYGETAQTFADKLFDKWFSTEEAQAHQVVLVLDTVTNTTGIRTGAAVKDLMSDDIAKSIASETVVAPLRQGNKYNQAFSDGRDRLVAVLSGKEDPGPPKIVSKVDAESRFAKAEETKSSNATVWVIGLLIAATVIPMATYYLYVKN
ncbi:beta-propeller domain-containing protein, methanol dehydrogenase [Merismopedia glauca CCAP 1448/3]|uniref:Beta-propeller domain-containing protein, methanol dehydrogenase n=2 Tax=Merismopedia TaxID=53402 RepID=A0A2T1BWR2_9CYAN|nr:beta-propeller domain-containing protein, methanol dehydrogenase [Merismopedia glauca CCAP 1448/3]